MRWLAIDGGGTSAKVRWESTDGRVEERVGGPCNWHTTPRDQWIATIREVTEGLEADGVYGCFAGVLTLDEEEAAAALKQATGAPNARAESDCAAALASFPSGTHIGVIAGTGSSIFSRVDGQLRRSGGGGPFLGDPGSAVDIARRWLNAHVVTAQPHPEPLPGQTEPQSRDAVLRWLYTDGNPTPKLASLFPALAAAAPDDAAIQESFRALAAQVNAHLATFHPDLDVAQIGLAGGVWKANKNLTPMFAKLLNSATIVEPSMTPVEGAMRLAKATFQ